LRSKALTARRARGVEQLVRAPAEHVEGHALAVGVAALGDAGAGNIASGGLVVPRLALEALVERQCRRGPIPPGEWLRPGGALYNRGEVRDALQATALGSLSVTKHNPYFVCLDSREIPR
jgi:hypothetical protein